MIRLIKGYVRFRGMGGDAILLTILLAKGVSRSERRALAEYSPNVILPGEWPA